MNVLPIFYFSSRQLLLQLITPHVKTISNTTISSTGNYREANLLMTFLRISAFLSASFHIAVVRLELHELRLNSLRHGHKPGG